MKLLFIGHAFHEKTKSSGPMRDMLGKHFSVVSKAVDPETPFDPGLIAAAETADIVLLWQMDYLAPLFLALGKRTVVAPMYDGSSLMPDLHWIWAQQALFLNFSLTLHHRIRRLGGQSRLLRYFPEPAAPEDCATFDDGLKVFLWQRRPQEGINLHLVERLLGDQIRHVHVHDAPDDPTIDTTSYLKPGRDDYALTVSKWFDAPGRYHQVLARHNVFIAPRRAEGIGLALLEAMARGMVIICTDQPTHTEYVANWINGVLIDPDRSSPFSLFDPASLGRMAWCTVGEGRDRWLADAARIPAIVAGLPPIDVPSVNDPESLGAAISRAYYSGLSFYRTFLLQQLPLIRRMSDPETVDRVGSDGIFNSAIRRGARQTRRAVSITPPWLQDGAIVLKGGKGTRHVTSGRVHPGPQTAWVAGHMLGLGFHVDVFSDLFSSMSLSLRLPPLMTEPQTLVIALNGWTLGMFPGADAQKRLDVEIPRHAMRAENTLTLQSCGLGAVPEIPEGVSLGLDEIRFL
jgi:hypothetical protein